MRLTLRVYIVSMHYRLSLTSHASGQPPPSTGFSLWLCVVHRCMCLCRACGVSSTAVTTMQPSRLRLLCRYVPWLCWVPSSWKMYCTVVFEQYHTVLCVYCVVHRCVCVELVVSAPQLSPPAIRVEVAL